MRIVAGEFLKVAARKSFLLAFVFFLGANAVFMITDDSGHPYGKGDYREAYASVEGMPPEEMLSYTEGAYHAFLGQDGGTGTDFYAKGLLFEALHQEMLDVKNYPDYVAKTLKEASGEDAVSIFQKQDSYSVRNAKRTGDAIAFVFGLFHPYHRRKRRRPVFFVETVTKRADKADGREDGRAACGSGGFKRAVSYGELPDQRRTVWICPA